MVEETSSGGVDVPTCGVGDKLKECVCVCVCVVLLSDFFGGWGYAFQELLCCRQMFITLKSGHSWGRAHCVMTAAWIRLGLLVFMFGRCRESADGKDIHEKGKRQARSYGSPRWDCEL